MARTPKQTATEHVKTDPRARYIELVRQRATIDLELKPIEAALRFDSLVRQQGSPPTGDAPAVVATDDVPAADVHLTIADLRRRFKRHPQTIYRWIKTKKLRPIPGVGRPYVFTEEEVQRFESDSNGTENLEPACLEEEVKRFESDSNR